jgi:hypothetical protein
MLALPLKRGVYRQTVLKLHPSSLWIAAAIDILAGGLLALPPLTGVGARRILQEGSNGGSFFIF